MEEWAKRIKELAKQRGVTDADIASACKIANNSVNQWFGNVKGKPATKDIRSKHLVTVAGLLGTTAEWIMDGRGRRESHAVELDPETLAHAFVSAEKALRKKGIQYDAAQVPEFLVFAYKERLHYPPGRDPAILSAYDRNVLAELERGRFSERQATRPADSGDREEAPQAEASRAKNGGSRRP